MPKSHHGYGNYLVAYSADRAHIAIAQQGASVVTVLDSYLDVLQQSIDTAMEILDIRFSNDTIAVVDRHKLARWSLKAGDIAYTAFSVSMDEPLAIDVCLDDVENLTLSNDCSHIAFTIGNRVYLYNVKSQKTNKYIAQWQVAGVQFSPDKCQWQYIVKKPVRLTTRDLLTIRRKYLQEEVKAVEVGFATEHKVLWVIHPQSPQGYYVGAGFKWVMDSRGRKLLWIPPNWRGEDRRDVRWEGNFLAIVKGQHLGPIIIEFPP